MDKVDKEGRDNASKPPRQTLVHAGAQKKCMHHAKCLRVLVSANILYCLDFHTRCLRKCVDLVGCSDENSALLSGWLILKRQVIVNLNIKIRCLFIFVLGVLK